MFRNNLRFLSLASIALVFGALSADGETLQSLIGDQDSFGTDLPESVLLSNNQIVAASQDPGDGDTDKWCLSEFAWRHEYPLPPHGVTVTAATLTIVTWDVEDNGAGDGLGGEPYDDLLFVDEVEIPNAFDEVFTPDGDESVPFPRNQSTFVLAPELLPLLADGAADVFLAPWGGQLFDCLIVDYSLLTVEYDEGIHVAIDVKPGSDPNCFNNNGHGVIPVAILGAADFDVTQVDLESLLFDGLEVRVRGNKGPLCSFEESNADTYLDLVCHFDDEPDNWMPGDTTATLVGALLDGTPFVGTDSICIRP